jgi:hydroxymethyl cephem carbamoyltransferase
MLIVGIKPGHDGAIAAVADGKLLYSLESEKDSDLRYVDLRPNAVLSLSEHVGQPPDVIALGGWFKAATAQSGGERGIGAGYFGLGEPETRATSFFGRPGTFFTSSHERSHIAMAVGMAPRNDSPLHVVLVWEGAIGNFYLLDQKFSVKQHIPVMKWPGHRYAFPYPLARAAPVGNAFSPGADAGKLMALAAYADPADADPATIETVERILDSSEHLLAHDFRDTALYGSGVESESTKIAAALLTQRIFRAFADVATEQIPAGLPLYISGGCGLNCDWNVQWRELGHFSSVFVPPCASDSGSALGTAIDAQLALTGDPYIEWDVYSGLEFEWDFEPPAPRWQRRKLDERLLADALASGRVVAWVQGRWEIGPRALGARSLLAEPYSAATKDRLNAIKQREDYRPIAPCCRLEDAGVAFHEDFEDPYMLYFRYVRMNQLGAITHVDGTARAQTVTKETNKPLHDLLTVFGERHGVGVLCNTSLNFKGLGFINCMSDLVRYCQNRGVPEIVVGDVWFSDMGAKAAQEVPEQEGSLSVS